MKIIPAHDRKRLADMAGVAEQYLYQCLTGRRSLKAEEAVRIEFATNKELRRWHLRPNDWWTVWPELVGLKGAPAVGGDQAEATTAGVAPQPAEAR